MAEDENKEDNNEEKNSEEEQDQAPSDENGEGAQPQSKLSTKGKKLLIIIVPILVILLGVLIYFLAFAGEKKHGEDNGPSKEQQQAEIKKDKQLFYEMEEFIINLSSVNNKSNFLKMVIVLQLNKVEDRVEIAKKEPLIRDSLQIFLKALRNDDLTRPGQLLNLKEEIMLRVHKITDPVEIKDVLFKEILIN